MTNEQENALNGCKITDKHIIFWSSIFSNFYSEHGNKPLFSNSNGDWNTSEQYFMWLKADFFEDKDMADTIYQCDDPAVAKAYGRMVKPYDDKRWNSVRETKMYEAVYDKFTKNTFCRNLILEKEFDGKTFVEGSPEDNIWGIGIIWNDPEADDETKWRGTNRLGVVLDRVREKIVSDVREKWIDPKVLLPDNSRNVLIYTEEGKEAEASYNPASNVWTQFRWSSQIVEPIAWREMPKFNNKMIK